jgi:hypothetical protein
VDGAGSSTGPELGYVFVLAHLIGGIASSEAFALIEDADPRKLGFEDTDPLLQQWAGLKPELVALGAADPDADVSAAAVGLRHAGNASSTALLRR